MKNKKSEKLKEIKIKMLEWKDFFGGEIMYIDEIKKAKNQKKLNDLFDRYIDHLHGIGIDSIKHAENFKKSLNFDI